VKPEHLRFETLVEQAGGEPLPSLDVADRVRASIGKRAKPLAAGWPIWQAAGLSAACALSVLILAVQQGVLSEDFLADWLRSLVLVMQ
jgi:hypothetical protein